jgi:hypothetical protein
LQLVHGHSGQVAESVVEDTVAALNVPVPEAWAVSV